METYSLFITNSILLTDLCVRLILSLRVIMRKKEASVTLAWLVVILLLPFVGAIIYLLLGENRIGLKRAEILAAVINSAVLVAISVYLIYEAVLRFQHPEPIQGVLMAAVASVGLAANIAGTLLLKRDAKTSINIRSSYFHLLSDAVSSAAVILGGLAIILWNIYWIDPVLTILISVYITRESFKILYEAVHVLMEGAPPDISINEIQTAVEEIDEVQNVHHVHIWMVGENDVHLEAHIDLPDMMISRSNKIGEEIENLLKNKFGINHVTLQFECDQCKGAELIVNGRH